MSGWRRRACARAGTSRLWPLIWSACLPTVSGYFSGRHFAAGGIHRAIDELARRRAELPAAAIAAALRQGADRELSPPITGPLSGLTDVLVHGGDIRIPLGLPFEPDPQLASLALDFLTGSRALGFVPLGRLRGICLQGSDIDRGWGRGAEVRGPVRALMMAACGRDVLLHLLDGPGLPLLRDRLTVFRDRP
jgi:uncharacterized protein (TIGR03083 family)